MGDSADELDSTWNTRSKYAADERFFFDIKANGCQKSSIIALVTWCSQPAYVQLIGIQFGLYKAAQAHVMQAGVRNVNNKSWAYTKHDKKHVKDNQKYVMCSGGVPKVSNVALQKRANGDFRTTWTYAPNCISAIKADKYRVEYTVKYKALLGLLSREKTETFTTSTSSHTLDTKSDLGIDTGDVTSVEVRSIQISPKDRLFVWIGASHYPAQEISNVKWDK